jgi:phosphopantetheine adenylyltransferase
VSAEARAELLREMVAADGGGALASRVEVHVVSGYVWRHAVAAGAGCLYRGIRTWAADGVAEKQLEVLNVLGPLLLGPLARPVPTRYLGADPRYAAVSSTRVRERATEAGAAGVADLVPPGFAEKLAALYA